MLKLQEDLENKERRTRRWSMGLFYGLITSFVLYIFFLFSSRIITHESEFEGEILFTTNNHGDFYVIFWHDKIAFPGKTNFLEKHMKAGFFVRKAFRFGRGYKT